MVTHTCPHLGRRDDPATTFNYPSVGNFCHHARPLAPPSEEHQQAYCLSGEYKTCPVFRAPVGKRLPPPVQMQEWIDPTTLSAPSVVQRIGLFSFILSLLVITALLIGAGLLIYTLQTGTSFLPASPILNSTSTLIPTRTIPPSAIPDTPTPTMTLLAPAGEVTAPPTSTPSPTSTPLPATQTSTLTSTLAPTVSPTEECGAPADWVLYTIRAGDTLFLISKAVGVTVRELQLANCLGASTQIFTGQKLYVPKLPVFPTHTPTLLPSASSTATETPTAEPPTATPMPPTPTPSATFTQIPPTSTPTNLPPTSTPLPPTSTSQVILDTPTSNP